MSSYILVGYDSKNNKWFFDGTILFSSKNAAIINKKKAKKLLKQFKSKPTEGIKGFDSYTLLKYKIIKIKA